MPYTWCSLCHWALLCFDPWLLLVTSLSLCSSWWRNSGVTIFHPMASELSLNLKWISPCRKGFFGNQFFRLLYRFGFAVNIRILKYSCLIWSLYNWSLKAYVLEILFHFISNVYPFMFLCMADIHFFLIFFVVVVKHILVTTHLTIYICKGLFLDPLLYSIGLCQFLY